jgi:hypothetical protein
MKKIVKSLINLVSIACLAIALHSCTKADIPAIDRSESETGLKKCSMVFDGGMTGFDQAPTKAGTSWNDGDKLYITFYNGSEIVSGIAFYSESEGWNIGYDGDLAFGTGLKCEVRHFVNTIYDNESLVNLNENSEIYEALDGSYDYNGNNLTVRAMMVPKTGRIRFTGTPGEAINLTGIKVFTTFAPGLNKFSDISSLVKTTVSADGYTPYIYGTLAEDHKKLGLIGSDYAYTKTCSDAVLKVGDSGYMAIPSEKSHTNWRSGLYVTVGGAEFKMIPVAGHSSGFFLIGETEVTNKLYNSVKNNSSSSNENYPKVNIYYSNCTDFITQLNYKTNLTFGMPTSQQWQYAAAGGNKSQGYTYSGSNNPGDVAWYVGNSGGKLHEVMQLAPNELGIYDMSGNVSEWISGSYANGGHYDSSEGNITVSSSFSANSQYSNVGFRIILKI